MKEGEDQTVSPLIIHFADTVVLTTIGHSCFFHVTNLAAFERVWGGFGALGWFLQVFGRVT